MGVWLQMAQDCAVATECNVQAMACARSGDYAAAVSLWHRSSNTGFGTNTTLYNLAICYENGLGVHRDISRVRFIYSFILLLTF
jgi:TPR repeat protein